MLTLSTHKICTKTGMQRQTGIRVEWSLQRTLWQFWLENPHWNLQTLFWWAKNEQWEGWFLLLEISTSAPVHWCIFWPFLLSKQPILVPFTWKHIHAFKNWMLNIMYINMAYLLNTMNVGYFCQKPWARTQLLVQGCLALVGSIFIVVWAQIELYGFPGLLPHPSHFTLVSVL